MFFLSAYDQDSEDTILQTLHRRVERRRRRKGETRRCRSDCLIEATNYRWPDQVQLLVSGSLSLSLSLSISIFFSPAG